MPEPRTFAAYLDRTERDQLDARAAAAEQKRDEALDDRDQARRERDQNAADLQATANTNDQLRDQLADMTDQRNERLTLAESSRLAKRYDEAIEARDVLRAQLDALTERYAALQRQHDLWKTSAGNRLHDLVKARDETQRQDALLDQAYDHNTEVQNERDRLSAELTQLRPKLAQLDAIRATYDTARDSLSRYRDAITAENTQWQAEIAHLRDLIGKYGDDGMIPAAALRKALRDGPPPALGSPRRAQEEPQRGEFCHVHFSWLCQAGQGRCQAGAEARP